MTPHDEDRLKAAAFHEAMPGTEAYPIDVTFTEDCGTLVDSVNMYAQIMPHYYTGKPALSINTSVSSMELDRVNELLALLTRARDIMRGGA